MASDSFDFGGFSSNIISDFGPILSLFGEQVAKQFMSQSMGWADHIIFAMAPLGIITAVVGAIRVGGPSWQRALVGRARESRAIAEVELLSSTSHEVCEMWDGQNLVRIMGSPEIRELIHITPKGATNGDSNVSEIWMINKHLEGNPIKERENRNLIVAKPSPVDPAAEEEHNNKPDLPCANDAPNIFLNTHSPVADWELNLVALLAVVLQIGVLIYACCSTYLVSLRVRLGSDTPPLWPLYCLLIGTASLALGMLGCCYIIETASVEQTHDLGEGTSRILWLQKGKTVNDQVFNSYAIFTKTPRTQVLTSRRNRLLTNESIQSHLLAVTTLAATSLSIAGFVVQFMGIRGMHWTVAVAQISLTIGMAAVRAWLRRSLSEAPLSQQLPVGHELDWLATRITHPEHQDSLWAGNDVRVLPSLWSWRKPFGGPLLLPLQHFWGQNCMNWMIATGGICDRYAETAENATGRAQQVFETRMRLGYLTRWPSGFSEIAIKLAAAIQLVIDNKVFPVPGNMIWTLGVGVHTSVTFKIESEGQSHTIDIAAIDAALSMWMFSWYDDEKNAGNGDWQDTAGKWMKSDGNPGKKFVQLLGPSGPSVRRDMGWWASSAVGALYEVDLLHPSRFGSEAVWIHAEHPYAVGSAGKAVPDGKYDFHRITRESLLEIRESDDDPIQSFFDSSPSPPAKDATRCLMRFWEGSQPELFAHEMFVSFMWTLAQQPNFPNIKSKAEVVQSPQTRKLPSFTLQNADISNLADSLHRIGFGTMDDIYLAIIPPLRATGRLPDPDAVADYIYKEASVHQQARNWQEATKILCWGFRTLNLLRKDPTPKIPHDSSRSELKWSGQPTAAIKATAAIVDCSRSLKLEEAKYAQNDSESAKNIVMQLANCQRGLMTEMNAARDTWGVISSLLQLYAKQGRTVSEIAYPSTEFTSEGGRKTPCFGHELAHASILSGDTSELYEDIRGLDLNRRDVLGWTPLHYAAKFRDLSAVQTLVAPGQASWNVRDLAGFTPLHYLAEAKEEKLRQESIYEGSSQVVVPSRDVSAHEREDQIITPLSTTDGKRPSQMIPDPDIAHLEKEDLPENHPYQIAATDTNVEPGEQPLSIVESGLPPRNESTDGIQNGDNHTGDSTGPHEGNMHSQPVIEFDDKYYDTLAFVFEGGKCDVDAQALDGSTPLHCATRCQNEVMTRRLLYAGANPQILDNSRMTPLHLAASSGSLTIVEDLLRGGASAHARDDLGQLPIHIAARMGMLAVAKVLIKGVEINARDKGSQTPLILAAANGHEDIVHELLQGKADVNLRARDGNALVRAAAKGHYGVVNILWSWQESNGVNHDDSVQALVKAAAGGFEEVVGWFLDNGVSVEAEDDDSETALVAAVRNGRCNVVTKLLKTENIHRPKHLLNMAARNGNPDMIRLLLEAKFDINSQDDDGDTPLHTAIFYDEDKVVRLLLKEGALTNIPNNAGNTARY